MAADIAPGGMRPDHGFSRWPGHDAALWDRLLAEARDRRRAGLDPPAADPRVRRRPPAVEAARANANRAGLKGYVTHRRSATWPTPPRRQGAPAGLVAVNPPYGERLGTEEELRPLYETPRQGAARALHRLDGGGLHRQPRAGLPARDQGPAPLRSPQRRRFRCRLFRLEIDPARFMRPSRGPADLAPEDLVNRLRKNLRTLEPWARRDGVTCCRAVRRRPARLQRRRRPVPRGGVGRPRAVVQEYAAPRRRRAGQGRAPASRAAVAAVTVVLEVPQDRVVMKERLRQKGHAQYEQAGRAPGAS